MNISFGKVSDSQDDATAAFDGCSVCYYFSLVMCFCLFLVFVCHPVCEEILDAALFSALKFRPKSLGVIFSLRGRSCSINAGLQ